MATAVTNGHVLNGAPEVPKDNALRFSGGIILPPPEIKSVIDRTAPIVARSADPILFEDKIRENQRSDPKFSFLNPADPFHAYYRNRMEKIAQGELLEEVGTGPKDAELAGVEPAVVEDVGLEPPVPEFILDLPNISSIDLDIMKLTALFTAQRGRSFLSVLAAKEGRNFQFDFLRPTHSLFGTFNRLVEQYTKILHPTEDTLTRLKDRTQDSAKWITLELSKRHARWERVKREKEQKWHDDQEAERVAFAEIDWHDYAIVQTIEFTAVDKNSELPAPMSVQEMESMTLAQKRMAAMIMESTAEDVEAHRAQQAAAEAEAAAAVGQAGISNVNDDEAAMEESDEEDEEMQERTRREEEERRREIERAQALQASSINPVGPMKIRTDYVPKLGEKKNKSAVTTCSICGQQIAVDELQEHMRIELLDPKWKSQRDVLEARKAQASELQRGANVVDSLKNLARTRVDIFGAEADEERRKQEEIEEKAKRREREKVVWDGHTASKAGTLDKFSTSVNFDEQIAAIQRAKGLGPQAEGAIGPGIGPAAPPPALVPTLPPAPSSLPPPPNQAANSGQYAAATVSSGPQPPSTYPNQPAPVMLPPLHYQGLDAPQPFGYQPPPLGTHPSRIAAMGVPGPSQLGVTRPAEEMDGVETPPAKRQKIPKLPGGQLYPEADWIGMHPYPITLQIELPNDPSKPEWKLDGSVVTIPDLPLNLLVSTLRERFILHTQSSVPASRIRLSYTGKMLANANSIASYNLEDEDRLLLSISPQRKK